MSQDRIVSYAQNREDLILSAFFHDVEEGTYVDVGANSPVQYSVTKYFYDRNWRGVNIEPSKNLFHELQKARLRDTNLNIGVSDNEGTLTLREYPRSDGLTTFSKKLQETYAKNPTGYTEDYQEYEVEVLPLRTILKEHAASHVNFLKVDAEGLEYEVLSGNDWKKYRPEIVCVEANHVLKDWRKILTDNKYTLVFNDGLNEYYLAEESMNRMKNFKYIEMILGRPVISHEWDTYLQKIENLEAGMRASRDSLIEQSKELRDTTNKLHHEIARREKLFPAIKLVIRAINHIINVRIEKLNRSSYSYAPISPKDYTVLTNAEIVDYTASKDRETYSRGPTLGNKVSRALYVGLSSLYNGTKLVAKKILKPIWKALKFVRKKLRSRGAGA